MLQRVALVLALALAAAAHAGDNLEGCEDRNGNVFYGDLDGPRHLRPDGACLPVGTWSRLRGSDRASEAAWNRSWDRICPDCKTARCREVCRAHGF